MVRGKPRRPTVTMTIDITAPQRRMLEAAPGQVFHAVAGPAQQAALDEVLALVAFLAGQSGEAGPDDPAVVSRMAGNLNRLLGDLVGFKQFLSLMLKHERTDP